MYDPDEQLVRSLPLLNAREMGGMPLEGGRFFATGRFIRASSPSQIKTREGINACKEYGIGTVIDLRSQVELERHGNPFREDPDTDFYSIPLFIGDPASPDDETMIYLKSHILGDFYIRVLEELGDDVARVMRVLLDSKRLVLFHCAHGKDRTGIIAALLYLLAGASREDIILNYKVSYGYLRSLLDPIIERSEEDLKHTLRSDSENMVKMLGYMSSKYGNVRNYFSSIGLSESEQQALYLKCLSQD